VNRAALERAASDFLKATGMELSDPNLSETPKRVAEAWVEFLDGYGHTPEEALGETYPAPAGSSGELVVVTDLFFDSMCPHHLIPYQGKAHLAYIPKDRVVGFGRLSALLDCFAHRLILQEELARQVASALARVLESPATACVIEAEQGCLRMRGHRQRQARTHAEAYEGRLKRDRRLRQELWHRFGDRR
jgi:GTP cyclohydrolase I